METLSGILAIASVLLFFTALVGILVPRWVRQPNRKGVLLKMLVPSFILFAVAGALLPKPENAKGQGKTEPQIAQATEESRVVAEVVPAPAPKPVQQPMSEPVPEPVSEPVSKISFKEIRRKMEGMTELQFDEYGKTLKGKRIRWSGYVEDVEEKLFGGYQVLVDMDSPKELMSVQDLTFEVSKKQALALKKDDRIRFEATISSVSSVLTMLAISFDDVKLIETSNDVSM